MGAPHFERSLRAALRRGALAFIACLVALLLLVPVAPAATQQELQEQYRQNQQAIKDAQEAKAAAELAAKAAAGDIQAMDQQIEALQSQLSEVSDRADAANERLGTTQQELNELNAQLQTARNQLDKAKADYAAQEKALEQRLVNTYKNGSLGFVEIVLSAREWSDFLNRIDLIADILRQDQQTLGSIEQLRQRVTEEEAALDSERAQVQEVEQRQAAEADELNTLVVERENAVDEVDAARSQKQEVLAKAEEDAAAYEAQEADLAAASDEIAAQLKAAGTTVPAAGATGVLQWPVQGEITSYFGMRTLLGVTRMHNGLDLAASMGTPIAAADGGTVVLADWNGGYGKCTIIDHGNGLATLYGHQSQIKVSVGQKVSKGEIIGLIGSTGYSTGPHLHFEVRVDGTPHDPLDYL